jgi:hypothetical protein
MRDCVPEETSSKMATVILLLLMCQSGMPQADQPSRIQVPLADNETPMIPDFPNQLPQEDAAYQDANSSDVSTAFSGPSLTLPPATGQVWSM